MKIIGINATHRKKRDTISSLLLEEALSGAKESGASVEKIKLSDYKIYQCYGCGECQKFRICPLTNNYDDQANELLEKIDSADGIIFSFPVYNFLPAGMLINFLQRIAPKKNLDIIDTPFYLEMYPQTKGYAFMNKKIGIICTGFSSGMENAVGSLFPFFTSMRATVCACTTIALNELNDLEMKPIIIDNIKTTNSFAFKIARAIGRRVFSGTQAFDMTYNYLMNFYEKKEGFNIFSESLEDLYRNKIDLNNKGKKSVMIIGGQKAIKESITWTKNIIDIIKEKGVVLIPVASIEKLPGFLTKDFIIQQIKAGTKDIKDLFTPLIDWDLKIANELDVDISSENPKIIIFNENGEAFYNQGLMFSEKNKEEIINKINGF